MGLDASTLAVVACIASALVAALLLFSWRLDRKTVALGWWSLALFGLAIATPIAMVHNSGPYSFQRNLANAISVACIALIWGAARRFNGRSIAWVPIVVAPLVYFAVMHWVVPGVYPRLVINSSLIAGFSVAAALELWRTSNFDLPARRAAAIVTAAFGSYFVLRMIAGITLAMGTPGPPSPPTMAWLLLANIVIVVFVISFGFFVTLMAREQADQEHRLAALIDPLTGVCNRRAFMIEASRCLETARRAGQAVSLVMFDLDHFKSINDNHGHLTGDTTLVHFCAIARSRLPSNSIIGRLGGEEFAVLLHRVAHDAGMAFAEAVRLDLEARADTVMGRPVSATVSAGVSTSADAAMSLETLLGDADQALYTAKAKGRNCVVASQAAATRAVA